MPPLRSPEDLEKTRQGILHRRDPAAPCIAVCAGTGCRAPGAGELTAAFAAELAARGLDVAVRPTGCRGSCAQGPVVVIYPEEICYVQVTRADVPDIVSQTVVEKKVLDRLLYTDANTGEKVVHEHEIPFYKNQVRLLTGDNHRIDPQSIDDYLAQGGYAALGKALISMSPVQVIDEIKRSGLRGRSGSGFPAGVKWEACQKAQSDTKYVICNCHEGDPGAFVDRMVLEANPHAVLEGMLLGGYAVGAHEGFIFVGDQFPQTVENIHTAIEQAEEYGVLGQDILGSGFAFTVKINIEGGGYVLGESTALMASMEGRIGEPVTKYDHATDRGLWAKPTVLNNLQTWLNVPLIMNRGADWYGGIGTENSKGTRIFSLAGRINATGMVEVPMGMTLREVVFAIGGGLRENKGFKAVQVGGPMGGFVPENLLDLRVDFDELGRAGLAMGPSLIVLDEDTCIVDMVKYFLTFLSHESCGKCTPCREGLRQMVKILGNITEGRGREDDLQLLERLSAAQKGAALCALGKGASNPLLSSLKHFREEYEAHLAGKRCPGGVCRALATA